MAEAQGNPSAARGRAQPLSREEELALAARARAGDIGAFNALIASQLPAITAVARRYSRYGLPVSDLIQEGVIGLLQALRRFNPAHGVRLSTYAALWVRAAIQDYVMRSWSLVRIGTTAAQKGVFFRLRRMAADMARGCEPSERIDEALTRLGVRFGVNADELRALVARIGRRDRSLDEPVARGKPALLDLLPDPRPSPEERTLVADEARYWARRLGQALASLPPREQIIIHRRYLADARDSFAAIARELGLSKERVRQLEAQALRELRQVVETATGAITPASGTSK